MNNANKKFIETYLKLILEDSENISFGKRILKDTVSYEIKTKNSKIKEILESLNLDEIDGLLKNAIKTINEKFKDIEDQLGKELGEEEESLESDEPNEKKKEEENKKEEKEKTYNVEVSTDKTE